MDLMMTRRRRRSGNTLAPNQLLLANFESNNVTTADASGTVAQMINFSRASQTLMQTQAGNYLNFASNQPAITNKGLKISPSVTNKVKSSSMSGAVIGMVGSGGSLPTGWSHLSFNSVEIISIGIEDGLPCLEIRAIYDNTASGSAKSVSIRAPSASVGSGETWVASTFYKLVSGTFVNNEIKTQLKISGNGGTSYKSYSQPYIADTRQRLVQTELIDQSDPVNVEYRLFNCNAPAGQILDVTFKLYAPQLEIGTYANDPVTTPSGATGVSAATTAYSDISSYNLANGSHFLEFDWLANGGEIFGGEISPTIGRNKACLSWVGSTLKIFLNGSLAATTTLTTANMNLNELYYGNDGIVQQVTMNAINAALYDTAFDDAKCVEMTT
ncbi:MAG: hypothetical protein OCD03_03070 [Hyphomicrobiales bacterium]